MHATLTIQYLTPSTQSSDDLHPTCPSHESPSLGEPPPKAIELFVDDYTSATLAATVEDLPDVLTPLEFEAVRAVFDGIQHFPHPFDDDLQNRKLLAHHFISQALPGQEGDGVMVVDVGTILAQTVAVRRNASWARTVFDVCCSSDPIVRRVMAALNMPFVCTRIEDLHECASLVPDHTLMYVCSGMEHDDELEYIATMVSTLCLPLREYRCRRRRMGCGVVVTLDASLTPEDVARMYEDGVIGLCVDLGHTLNTMERSLRDLVDAVRLMSSGAHESDGGTPLCVYLTGDLLRNHAKSLWTLSNDVADMLQPILAYVTVYADLSAFMAGTSHTLLTRVVHKRLPPTTPAFSDDDDMTTEHAPVEYTLAHVVRTMMEEPTCYPLVTRIGVPLMDAEFLGMKKNSPQSERIFRLAKYPEMEPGEWVVLPAVGSRADVNLFPLRVEYVTSIPVCHEEP
eukprot:PhF_6_TR32154/c0_g1_i1/m.47689